MTRYVPGRHYLPFGIAAMLLAAFSAWLGFRWSPAFIPAVLFMLTSGLLLALGLRPAIEVHENYLGIGDRTVAWTDIRRVDRTGWISPLVIEITLFDDSRFRLIYPGDLDSCNSLLRRVRQLSRDALIDGRPYGQFWNEVLASPADRKKMAAPRYRLLRPEDEAEVERMFQRLKTVGNLDQKSSDEK